MTKIVKTNDLDLTEIQLDFYADGLNQTIKNKRKRKIGFKKEAIPFLLNTEKRINKLEKLAHSCEVDVDDLLRCKRKRVYGICTNRFCNHIKKVSRECTNGFCKYCKEYSIQSCLVLGELI